MDVGRAEQLLVATQAVLAGTVKTALSGLAIGEGTAIATSAEIIGQTAVGRNCRIGDNSHLENCILMDDVMVGNNVRLNGVIVDSGVVIEEEVVVSVRGQSLTPVIAAKSLLAKGTRLQL